MRSPHQMLIETTIHRVAQLVQQRIDEEIRDTGLTRLSWIATSHVAASPGLSIGDLAERLEVGSATTGQLVERMVKGGWVERRPSLHDRRALSIRPTPKARQILRELEPRRARLEHEILQDLTAEERRLLLALLERIRARLSRQAG